MWNSFVCTRLRTGPESNNCLNPASLGRQSVIDYQGSHFFSRPGARTGPRMRLRAGAGRLSVSPGPAASRTFGVARFGNMSRQENDAARFWSYGPAHDTSHLGDICIAKRGVIRHLRVHGG